MQRVTSFNELSSSSEALAILDKPDKHTAVVVKLGTSSILSDAEHGSILALSTLASVVETLCALRKRGYGVVLVTSGAVGVGCHSLGTRTRPSGLAELQALAAIGQPRLMHHYETLFSALDQPIAQVLLSADALDSSSGYANVQQTIVQLLALGVIPIVNENNAVSISELRFGDNDTLSALVALMVGAEHLFLATDVDALYTSNPTAAPTPGAPPARPIREVTDVAQAIKEVEAAEGSNAGSQWGTGGIATKLRAAQLAGAAGVTTVIISAKRPQDIATILGGATDVGTRFNPNGTAVRSHKRWIMALPAKGSLQLDSAAARALVEGSSLCAVGLVPIGVKGTFEARDAVRVLDDSGVEIARGIANYSSAEATLLIGVRSSRYSATLGYNGPEYLIKRTNLVLLANNNAGINSRLGGVRSPIIEGTAAAERGQKEKDPSPLVLPVAAGSGAEDLLDLLQENEIG